MKTLLKILLLILFSTAASGQESGMLQIRFQHMVGSSKLVLGPSGRYINANGDDYRVSVLKYYISNLQLYSAEGKMTAVPDSYILVNAADPSSLRQDVPGIPEGIYTGIGFTIGIDSTANYSGAKSGNLDPGKGMYWTWNSGYIFLKFEGESSRSTAKGGKISLHIGGSGEINAAREFRQNFPGPLVVSSQGISALNFRVDVAALFAGVTKVDFSILNSVMGGPKSKIIADNYQNGFFNILTVENFHAK
jgi:hypothetical protein